MSIANDSMLLLLLKIYFPSPKTSESIFSFLHGIKKFIHSIEFHCTFVAQALASSNNVQAFTECCKKAQMCFYKEKTENIKMPSILFL